MTLPERVLKKSSIRHMKELSLLKEKAILDHEKLGYRTGTE